METEDETEDGWRLFCEPTANRKPCEHLGSENWERVTSTFLFSLSWFIEVDFYFPASSECVCMCMSMRVCVCVHAHALALQSSYKSLQSHPVKPKCLTLWGCFNISKTFIAGFLCRLEMWFKRQACLICTWSRSWPAFKIRPFNL